MEALLCNLSWLELQPDHVDEVEVAVLLELGASHIEESIDDPVHLLVREHQVRKVVLHSDRQRARPAPLPPGRAAGLHGF